MEITENPTQEGLLMAQALQKQKFGSSYQVKNYNHLRYLLRKREYRTSSVEKVIMNTSYDQVSVNSSNAIIIMSTSSLLGYEYVCVCVCVCKVNKE